MGTFRIQPDYWFRYKLQKRFLFIFWFTVSLSDSADVLRDAVKQSGGKLVS